MVSNAPVDHKELVIVVYVEAHAYSRAGIAVSVSFDFEGVVARYVGSKVNHFEGVIPAGG